MTSIPRHLVHLLTLAIFVVAGIAPINATTFSGTVISVTGDVAKVAMTGDVMPPNGARAEFFFKIAGGADEIFVATGSALKIDQGDMLVKIADATGTVEKGHLVRFSLSPSEAEPVWSPIPTASSEPASSPESSPPPDATETNASIVGMWMGVEPGGDKVSFTFRADDTVSYVRLPKGKKKRVLRGKYRIDCTVTPCRVEIYDYERDGVAEDKTLIGLFQIQEFGFNEFSMRFDLSQGLQENPENGFTSGVVTLIRAKTDTPSATPSSNDPD